MSRKLFGLIETEMSANMKMPFRRLFGRSNGTKALTEMRHDGRSSLLSTLLLPATNLDYEKEVGNGLGSSVLMAPLNWIMRTFPEAPPIIEELEGEEWKTVTRHPLGSLLRRPNPFYTGRAMWMATVLDFVWGNAYWLKIRNEAGNVVQLWWVPRQLITPKWPNDGKTFISHYEYKPGGRTVDLGVDDVVHFRSGIDPRNTRLGLSQLGSLFREVATDDQAANFAGTVLRNLGIIGVIISPKEGKGANPADVKMVHEYIKHHFTGDKRGEPLAIGSPTDVNLLQYNMQGFDVSPIRDVSEERVCAALGIPAAVVGFGTGLQQTKVGATMQQMRQLAWTGSLIPTQEIIADEICRSLIHEFGGNPDEQRMRFDISQVKALWEDKNEKHDRVRKDMMARMITVGEARLELGYPADDSHDVYVQPVNVIQIPSDTAVDDV
ncbi:MAG: phage portal protein [Gemmatimonadales bacterium]